MNQLKRRMIQRALRIHRKIFPCAHRTDFTECFTQHKDNLLFWYNTEDCTTHVLTRKIPRTTREASPSADR